MTDVGIVLAAGEGRRFGGPKAPYVFHGERLVDRAVRVLREGGCDFVIVVLGAWHGEVPNAEVVTNPDWSSGMASSLRTALVHAHSIPADRAVVSLVDLPGLTPAAVERLRHCASPLAAAAYAGERGHPVLIHRDHWEALSSNLTGDSGARAYLTQHGVTLVEVGDIASGDDLDLRPAT